MGSLCLGLLNTESSSGNKAGMVKRFPVRTDRGTEGGSASPGGVGLKAERASRAVELLAAFSRVTAYMFGSKTDCHLTWVCASG